MKKTPRNRTLTCSKQELVELSGEILKPNTRMSIEQISNRVAQGDIFKLISYLPKQFVDLLILDPPYNLSKDYHGTKFKNRSGAQYQTWFESLLDVLMSTLKPDATVYVCSEWRTSVLIGPILQSKFNVHNRITWEREKGRGARSNWKNNSEDIWFCTKSDNYFFNAQAVRLKRKVIAPYRTNGEPKDWLEEENGKFRLTFPSNIWTDITVPFWSMRENTDHPTQKPEKLIAKLMLASSKENDFVFDPFLGSGTTASVATKLGRRWFGVDCNQDYLCWALKRIRIAESDSGIQGYNDEIFWERNSANTV